MSSTMYSDTTAAAYWPAVDAGSPCTGINYAGHTALSDASVCSPATTNTDSDIEFTASDIGKSATGKLCPEVAYFSSFVNEVYFYA